MEMCGGRGVGRKTIWVKGVNVNTSPTSRSRPVEVGHEFVSTVTIYTTPIVTDPVPQVRFKVSPSLTNKLYSSSIFCPGSRDPCNSPDRDTYLTTRPRTSMFPFPDSNVPHVRRRPYPLLRPFLSTLRLTPPSETPSFS